jgi:flagellar L-ring protein precursor FlgH
MKRHLLLVLFVPLLSGCFSLEPSKIKNEPFTISNTYRVREEDSKPPEAKGGSVWQGQLTALFSDQRARNVGDILTVTITETSTASENATTTTSRQSQTVGQITGLLGLENHQNGPLKDMPNLINSYTPYNNFQGAGATTRGGSLNASITARVMEVLPSGNLAIEGKREIYVNNEKKEILLQGIVRPRDIAFDNSVLSTQVADAKIIYTGIGVVAEKQRPGWGQRLFDYIWPF